jgi:hypothetical protein
MGLRVVWSGKERACKCVYRAIFRACYNRFRASVASAEHVGAVALEYSAGPKGYRYYGRKSEEFVADFCMVARRYLSREEYEVFNYFFILEAGLKLCCRQLKIDKGTFCHRLYHVEETLGRVFATLEPYPLYPVSEYFAGVISRNRLRDLLDDLDVGEEEEFEEPVAA